MILQVGAKDEDRQGLDRLTRQLRTHIEDLDVESIALGSGEPLDAGAKAADLIAIGTLVVQLAPTALMALVHVLQAWVRHGSGREVKLEAHLGSKAVRIEYPARQMTQVDVTELVSGILSALGEDCVRGG